MQGFGFDLPFRYSHGSGQEPRESEELDPLKLVIACLRTIRDLTTQSRDLLSA